MKVIIRHDEKSKVMNVYDYETGKEIEGITNIDVDFSFASAKAKITFISDVVLESDIIFTKNKMKKNNE